MYMQFVCALVEVSLGGRAELPRLLRDALRTRRREPRQATQYASITVTITIAVTITTVIYSTIPITIMMYRRLMLDPSTKYKLLYAGAAQPCDETSPEAK